jgi:hypothetical protein
MAVEIISFCFGNATHIPVEEVPFHGPRHLEEENQNIKI